MRVSLLALQFLVAGSLMACRCDSGPIGAPSSQEGPPAAEPTPTSTATPTGPIAVPNLHLPASVRRFSPQLMQAMQLTADAGVSDGG